MKLYFLLTLILSYITVSKSLLSLINRFNAFNRFKLYSNKAVDDSNILKKIDKWACIKNCGACCKLGPLDSRPDLEEYLTKDELIQYKSMIGQDDWCINYDQINRICKIYEIRPNFCRVNPVNFKKMYAIEEEEFNDFCTFCCTESIADVYGEDSDEMIRFEDIIESLEDDDKDK